MLVGSGQRPGNTSVAATELMVDMLTLWDLVKQVLPAPKPAPPKRLSPPTQARTMTRRTRPSHRRAAAAQPDMAAAQGPVPTMEARYEEVTRHMLQLHGVKVRRWRKHMSGIAWEVYYRDGRVVKLIEAPRPKGPMSAAVFLHEIGHHAIGFGTYKPRCLEEYHAWTFAIDKMEQLGLNVTESVRRRMHNSLRYAVEKASRRGLRQLPPELHPFTGPFPGDPARHRRG